MAVVEQEAAELLRPEALDPGTNLLVTGPVMTGKRRLLLALLARASSGDDGAILTTTRKTGETVVREFTDLDPHHRPPERLRVVDCLGARRDDPEPPWKRRYVSDPGDLTGVGIGLSEFLREFSAEDRTALVALHSLSTMQMYANVHRLFQFLHVVTGRIRAMGNIGGFVLDDTTRSGETAILRQPVDAMLEIRETDEGSRQLRARGADIAPRSWTDFPR